MFKYLIAIIEIIKNYKFFSFFFLFYELIYFLKFRNNNNKFKYLNSKYLSDSIPVSFYLLKLINRFIIENNIKNICDLGSGFGKILFYLGKIKKLNIDGYEYDKEIFNYSLRLKNNNINIFNKDILKLDYKNLDYELYIINDPLKKSADLKKLFLLLSLNKKKKYYILINFSEKKQVLFRYLNFDIISKKIFSKNRNIFFASDK